MRSKENYTFDSNLVNAFEQVEKAFGDVPSAYGTLVDLGLEGTRDHLILNNTLNTDITLKFAGNASETAKELVLKAGVSYFMDKFKHDGLVQYKYNTGAPSGGALQMVSWF